MFVIVPLYLGWPCKIFLVNPCCKIDHLATVNARTQGLPLEYCTVARSMLFTSFVIGFTLVTDKCIWMLILLLDAKLLVLVMILLL